MDLDLKLVAGEGATVIGVCIVNGTISVGNEEVSAGNMLISKEERHIFWNFVASDKALIEAAKEKWKEKKFEMLPDDNSYIAIP